VFYVISILTWFHLIAGELILEGNAFQGDIPDSLVNLGTLEVLNLSRNGFMGSLPDGFAAGLQNLLILNLSRNFFAGNIPADIGTMSRLIEIRLNTNFEDPFFGFRGPIPTSIGLLENLLRLDLNENRLTGELPASLGYLNNLQLLNVGVNPSLEGGVPPDFENLANLKAFYITGTGIIGAIPGALCNTNAFIEVDCSDAIQCDCCECYEPEAV
jgi:Leucine-rich repeat (LRR) protein